MENYLNGNLALDKEISDIKVAMKETKNIRMYKRYLVILKHLEGNSNIAIAEMVSLEQHAVGDYIRNYKANGLPGLEMKHSTGAPRKLNKEQEALLFETITAKTPDEVGFESRKNWTIEIVRQWIINTFAVKHSHRGTHEVLRRLNYAIRDLLMFLRKLTKRSKKISK